MTDEELDVFMQEQLAKCFENFYKKNEAKFTELKINSEIVKQIYCAGAISAASILIQANG